MPSISARQALALLALDLEVIHVLVLDDALDGDVERNLLRGVEVVVRLLLVHGGQRPDVEGAQLRHAAGGAERGRRVRRAGSPARS